MVCMNTSITMMLMPFALGILEKMEAANSNKGPAVEEDCKRFGTAVMLGIAYAASCGGIATTIGSTSNMVLVGVMDSFFKEREDGQETVSHSPTFSEYLVVNIGKLTSMPTLRVQIYCRSAFLTSWPVVRI